MDDCRNERTVALVIVSTDGTVAEALAGSVAETSGRDIDRLAVGVNAGVGVCRTGKAKVDEFS